MSLIRRILSPIIFILSIAGSLFASGSSENILFMGNSLFYSFDMPGYVSDITTSMHKNVSIDQITHSNASILSHLQNINTVEFMQSKEWDHVICNENNYILVSDDRYREELIPGWNKLAEVFSGRESSVHVMINWGFKKGILAYEDLNSYEKMQSNQIDVIEKSTRERGFSAIPVGLAWKQFRQEYPQVELYCADGIHPSEAGAYLGACVIYSFLFNEKVSKGEKLPYGIADNIIQEMRRIAWEAVRDYAQ